MLKCSKQKFIELPDRFNHFIASKPWDKYSTWTIVIFGILAVASSIYATWHLPLGMADESFYVYVIREQVPTRGTFFALYLKAFRECSILSLRYLSLGLKLFATGVFSMSVYRLFAGEPSKRGLVKFMFCGMLCHAMLSPQSVSVPSYIPLGYFWGMLAIAALFFAFAAKSAAWRCVGLLASGFCCSQLFLDMFPSAVMILLVFLAVCCIGVRPAICWMLGALLGFGAYFVLLQSPAECLHQIVAASKSVNGNTRSGHVHDFAMLVRWSIDTALFFVSGILGYCIAVCVMTRMSSRDKTAKFYFGFAAALCMVIVAAWEVLRSAMHTERTFSIEVLYVLFALAVWTYWGQRRSSDLKKSIAFILLFVAPVFLCLGTNVSFEIRALSYAMLLVLPVLLLSNEVRGKYLAFFVFLLVTMFAIRFFLQFNARSWATGEKFFTPTTRLDKYGINIAVSSKQAREISKIEENTRGVTYLVGDPFCWQYIVTLNKKSPSRLFDQSSSDLRREFSNHKITQNDVAFVENLKGAEKDYFPGWVELYRQYFNAKKIVRIPIDESKNILVFR